MNGTQNLIWQRYDTGPTGYLGGLYLWYLEDEEDSDEGQPDDILEGTDENQLRKWYLL